MIGSGGMVVDRARFDYNTEHFQHKLLIAIPTTGSVRMEWAAARYGQVIPVNWSAAEFAIVFTDQLSPIGYVVHDARNLCVKHALDNGVEWLLFIDHDVILPPTFLQSVAQVIDKGDVPVWSGLYYTKGEPSEPLIFKGRGNGPFRDWDQGDKVWCDGIPMGMALIHTSVLIELTNHVETYQLPNGDTLPKWFWTPRDRFIDPESGEVQTQVGTEDLYWCDQVMKNDVLKLAGWKVPAPEHPFLLDTGCVGKHIDTNTGRQYP